MLFTRCEQTSHWQLSINDYVLAKVKSIRFLGS